jgi:hypothetical protein
MSQNLAYPLNPDTSFESFILTDEAAQKAIFGKTYGPSDLVPMNYQKILMACKAGTLSYAPLREFQCVAANLDINTFDTESASLIQSQYLRFTMLSLLSYWNTKLALIAPFQCPLGIVTEMKTNSAFQNFDPLDPSIIYLYTMVSFKINWFVIPGSLYS